MSKNCLIVMSGENDDYYGIYCHEYDDDKTITKLLNEYYSNRDVIELLFSNGTIYYIRYNFPWIKFKNRGTSDIQYFFDYDELVDCYKYVDNIFVFTNSGEWTINPKPVKKEINPLDEMINFILD